MKEGSYLFNRTEHFYADGSHKPVAADEDRKVRQEIKHSRVSFFFMGMILATALVYMLALIIDSIGLRVNEYTVFFIVSWLAIMSIITYLAMKSKFSGIFAGGKDPAKPKAQGESQQK